MEGGGSYYINDGENFHLKLSRTRGGGGGSGGTVVDKDDDKDTEKDVYKNNNLMKYSPKLPTPVTLPMLKLDSLINKIRSSLISYSLSLFLSFSGEG